VFNRALTYYTFHIGLNYLVIGWLVTSSPKPQPRLVWFLAGVFIFHNICAWISYTTVFCYLRKRQRGSGDIVPPYVICTGVMISTLIALVGVWIIVPFVCK
jgi:surface polysaccharide O-acyltransferase-like enzyme